jgi:hypothetical protein
MPLHHPSKTRATILCLLGTMGLLLGCSSVQAQDAFDRLKPDYLASVRSAIENYALQRTEVPRSGPLREIRANLHVHSELSHDSIGKIEEVVAAAKRAGTEALLFTEHPSKEKDFFLEGHQGMLDGVLLIPGAEMKGMLVYPTLSLRPFENLEPQDLTQVVRTRGGHVFLSHLEERMDWELRGLTGVEIYNTHADFKKQKRLVEAMKNPLWLLKTRALFERYPQEAFSALQDYPADYLKRWDELCQQAPHTGVAANDAHQNVGVRLRLGANDRVIVEDPLGEELLQLQRILLAPILSIPEDAKEGDILFSLQLDPYENSLRHAGTHLLVTDLTREAVWESLEAGRVFVAFDWLADARGFDVAVLEDAAAPEPVRHEMGSRLDWKPELVLTGRAPLPTQWRWFRNGNEVGRSEGDTFQQPITEPGVYRVEAWLAVGDEPHIWILSNPFYIAP